MNYSDVYDAEKKAWENATKFPCSDLDRLSFRVGFEKCAEWLSCLGWHPASEFPVILDGEYSVHVIALCITPSGICAPVEVAYTRTSGWQYSSVKWWCYPPKEG